MELYRWIEFAHHKKRLNLEAGVKFDKLNDSITSLGAMSALQKDRLTFTTALMVNYAKAYLRIQERIRSMSTLAGDMLAIVSGHDLRESVSVSFGEALSGTYPKP
jgi:hypothetical protein